MSGKYFKLELRSLLKNEGLQSRNWFSGCHVFCEGNARLDLEQTRATQICDSKRDSLLSPLFALLCDFCTIIIHEVNTAHRPARHDRTEVYSRSTGAAAV